MKKIICLILLLSCELVIAQPDAWNFLNHQSGGYVTEIIPVKYPAGLPGNISQQVLYARTDVGGIYRSGNNGATWDFDACYFRNPAPYASEESRSEFVTQGAAIRQNGLDPTLSQTIVVGWGWFYGEPDALSANYNCIWRSDNNGNTGSWTKGTVESPGVWFKGDDLRSKMGGECITYDPNNIDYIRPPASNTSRMYMGGFGPTGYACHLFRSDNDGRSWYFSSNPQLNNFPGQAGEGIICISMKQGDPNNIWVGTTNSIIFTTNGGTNWNRVNIPGNATPYIKRILLQKTGNVVTGAMVTWGDYNSTGIGRLRASFNNWSYEPLNTLFFTGVSQGSQFFSALAFMDDAESIIVSGQFDNPLRKTSNFGDSWFGDGGNTVNLTYHPTDNKKPSHRFYTEAPGLPIYDGMSCLTRNPNTGWGTQWYMSGGSGGRMTTADYPVNSNNLGSARWAYTVTGQTMPVIYDINFNTNIGAVFMPMADWTLGWAFNNNVIPSPPATLNGFGSMENLIL